MFDRWLRSLNVKTTPQFGQLINWVLLVSAVLLACVPFNAVEGARNQAPATLLFWLSERWISSLVVHHCCRGALVLGAGLWLLQRGLPWSCWLTTVAFTAVWSLHVETTTNTAHIFNMANMLLVIQSLWITAEAPAIRAAIRTRHYYETPLLPRWVVLAGITYIGLFHTSAGLSKLSYSGPGWASGVSLQLWTHLWGRNWAPTTHLILGNRRFAETLQWAALIVELVAILAIVPRLRLWIGISLLAFYAGVLLTFDYGFQLNAILTGLYLLPVESWLSRRKSRSKPFDSAAPGV